MREREQFSNTVSCEYGYQFLYSKTDKNLILGNNVHVIHYIKFNKKLLHETFAIATVY